MWYAITVDQIPIGRFSVITRLTQNALRYYDKKGLLVPEAKDTITGYRSHTGPKYSKESRSDILLTWALLLMRSSSIFKRRKKTRKN
jgi:hypothetical protein